MAAQDHYTIISADTHAGGSHEQYREYLDPAYRDDFDAWRGQYKNPWKDLRDTDLRIRNWDDDRRDADQLSDGVVGEVVFPNTVPPFYPGFVLFAGPPKPEDYEHRRAGIHAHNRWMVDFCGRQPERRAGIGQFFLNDVDDAIADITWIKEQGLRGGILLPSVAPDVKWVEPIYSRVYDPLWAAIQDLDLVINLHSGTGSPDYGRHAATPMLLISEVAFYGQRAFAHMIVGGVFERFPKLKFVFTEGSAAGLVPHDQGPRRRHPSYPEGCDRRAQVPRGGQAPAPGERVLRPQLLGRCQLPEHPRRRDAQADGRRPLHVGQRLPARRGHAAVHA